MLPNSIINSDELMLSLGIVIRKRKGDFFKYNYFIFDLSKTGIYI